MRGSCCWGSVKDLVNKYQKAPPILYRGSCRRQATEGIAWYVILLRERMIIMAQKYNKALNVNARELRNNMTKEENHLWYDFLKSSPWRFARQKVLGKYIADFYCASAQLVIELDGSQHYSAEGIEYDRQRTEYLNGLGLRVIRIPNNDINNNFAGVCAYIERVMGE